jgi:hypothetical protein
MRASSTLPPGSPSSSPHAGRRLWGRVVIGGVVAVAVAALVGSLWSPENYLGYQRTDNPGVQASAFAFG